MANGIIPVSWGKELRPSAVNTLDKINEVIHFINQSEIHEFTFSDSGSGESVQTANSTQLMNLTVYGKSVQDGTPTPENPVPVQVVGGRNLLKLPTWAELQACEKTGDYWNYPIQLKSNASYYLNTTYDSTGTPTHGGYALVSNNKNNTGWKAIAHASQGVVNGVITTGNNGIIYVNVNMQQYEYEYMLEHAMPQLEAGTQATPYTPYGCIGLQIGETVTPIDLQGHTLASLPDGTRDVLRVDSAGRVTLTQNVGVVTITGTAPYHVNAYDGKGIITQALQHSGKGVNTTSNLYCNIYRAGSDAYITSTGNYIVLSPPSGVDSAATFNTWLASNPATLNYLLATPVTIELGTITPPAIPDGSIITINASLTPTIDVKWFTEDTLPEMMNAILGLIKSLHPDDFTANALNANIVHSIQPIDIQPISDIRPISDIQPIEDIEIMQDENESEE